MRKNIYFYCPSKKIGGEQQLYIRCSEYLSIYTNFNIYYIDYEDGFARNQLLDTKVQFIEYIKGKKIQIKPCSCVVVALAYVDEINSIMVYDESDNFLLWSLQPSNLTGKLLIKNKYLVMLPSLKRKFKEVVSALCYDGTIRFMDYNNYFTVNKFLNVDIDDVNYLPVPIDDKSIRELNDFDFHQLLGDKVNFMWLSRIDQDKKYTLLTMMGELRNIYDRVPCRLYIVGDGNALKEIKMFSKECPYEVVFKGRIFGNELDDFIDTNVDIGLAMGTSALEIAKRGKPVIMKTVLPKVYAPGVVKDYIFLHQQYGYSLGSPDKEAPGQSDFLIKIQELQSNYSELAQNDYEYTRSNHSLAVTCGLISSYLENLKSNDFLDQHLRMNELCSLIKNARKFTFRYN